MSRSTIRIASANAATSNPPKETVAEPRRLLFVSLGNYAVAGLAAVLLLSLIELVDLNIQLTPVFQSFSERAALAAYSSVNLVVGSFIAVAVGLVAHVGSHLKSKLEPALASNCEVKLLHKLSACLLLCGVASALLYFQPNVFRYTLGAIREAEKVPHVAYRLLNLERLAVYLSITGLLISCWIVWSISRAAGSLRPLVRYAWIVCIILIIAFGYYLDSRIEVQLYEPSFHRSMFLLELTLALALIASVHSSLAHQHRARLSLRRTGVFCAAVLLVEGLVFTFVYFDKNQNLKTQVFFRSSQTKQYFKLAQWALDFDRDVYASVLGGGDAEDRNAAISPGRPEIVDDGVDNNCIGGDTSQRDLDAWMYEHNRLNTVPNPAAKRFNVVFIFVDAVRADHMSLYGYGRSTTPNLSKFGERATVFDNAIAPSPFTFESMPKFMKSSYWDAHVDTWTEVLAHAGYNTILFPRRTATMLRYVKGMSQVIRDGTKGLSETVNAAIETLGAAPSDRPLCAFVYVSDPHRPYVQHREFDFGRSIADLYDGELAYTDFHLGRLFDWLDKSGRLLDTIVVVMADHGESLGERGVYKHATQLYNEQTRVPMVVRVPDVEPGRIADFVSTVDLGSTILIAVGLSCPKEYTGVSLLPLMRGEAFTRLPVYSEQTMTHDSQYVARDQDIDGDTKKYMVITQDGYKLIYSRDAYCFELFNLKDDPREEHNLFNPMTDKAAQMKGLVGRFADVVTISRPPDADEKKYGPGFKKSEDRPGH